METVVATPEKQQFSEYLKEEDCGIFVQETCGIDKQVVEGVAQRVLDINASWLWEWSKGEEDNTTTAEDWASYVYGAQAWVYKMLGTEMPYFLHLYCGVVDELNTMELLGLVQFPDEWISWVLQEADTSWQFIWNDGEYKSTPQDHWKQLESMSRWAYGEAIKARSPEHDIPQALALSGAFAASVQKHMTEATNRNP